MESSEEVGIFLSGNGVFENVISPEPTGIFRRGKGQPVAYVRDFSAAKPQFSLSHEDIAGDSQNLAHCPGYGYPLSHAATHP